MEEKIRDSLFSTTVYKQKRYSDFSEYCNGLAYYYDWINGVWTYINANGEEVLNVKYQKVKSFHEGLAAVQNKDGLWGYIDINGNEVIPCQYDDAEDFKTSLASVKSGKKFGAINQKGEEVMPFKFSYPIRYLGNDLFAAYKKNSAGLYNKDGKELVAPKYYSIHPFVDGIAEVISRDHAKGFINQEGKEVIPCTFCDNQEVIVEGYRIIGRNQMFYGNYVLMNNKGKFFNSAPFYDDGKNKWSIISSDLYDYLYRYDNTGDTYRIYNFSEGWAEYREKDRKYNFINLQGEKAFKDGFDCGELCDLHEGWAKVYLDYYRGSAVSFINIKGERISDNLYQAAGDFNNGIAIVQGFNDLFGAIDTTGKEVIPCIYKKIGKPNDYSLLVYTTNFHMPPEGVIYVSNDEFRGYINSRGEIVKDLSQEIYYAEIKDANNESVINFCKTTSELLSLELAKILVNDIKYEKEKEVGDKKRHTV